MLNCVHYLIFVGRMAEGGIQLQADNETRHQKGMRAARSCDFERIREMNFIPTSKESWNGQYL